jgi:hypothetical protein
VVTAEQARKLPDGTRVVYSRKNSYDDGDEGRIDHASQSILWDDDSELSFTGRQMRYVKKID